jgi:hypothetical protein
MAFYHTYYWSGHKDLKVCALEEALDEARFAPDPLHRSTEFAPQMQEMKAAQVAHLDPFELLPDTLVRIQLGGIGRQTLEMKAMRRAVGEELPDGLSTVDGRSIPDDDHSTRDFPEQMFQEGHHVC